MSEQNSQFLPEHVDEQVEALSQAQMGTKHGRSANARLVAHLHQVYQEETEIGEQVWARLARYAQERHGSGILTSAPSSPNAASSQRDPVNQHRLFSIRSGETSSLSPLDQQSTQSFPLQGRPDPLQEAHPRFESMSSLSQRAIVSLPKKHLSRRLALLAATLVCVVLVGSLTVVLTSLHGRNPATTTVVTQPQSTPTTPPTPTVAVPASCIDKQDLADQLLCSEGTETALNITKSLTVDVYDPMGKVHNSGTVTVTFLRAYADTSRLLLVYNITSAPHGDWGGFGDLNTAQGVLTSGSSNFTGFTAASFDVSSLPAGTSQIRVQSIQVGLYGKTLALSFSVPVHTNRQMINIQQTASNSGYTLTLDHLVLTDSQSTFSLNSPQTDARAFMIQVKILSINKQTLPVAVSSEQGGPGKTGGSFYTLTLYQQFLHQSGTWTIIFALKEMQFPPTNTSIFKTVATVTFTFTVDA